MRLCQSRVRRLCDERINKYTAETKALEAPIKVFPNLRALPFFLLLPLQPEEPGPAASPAERKSPGPADDSLGPAAGPGSSSPRRRRSTASNKNRICSMTCGGWLRATSFFILVKQGSSLSEHTSLNTPLWTHLFWKHMGKVKDLSEHTSFESTWVSQNGPPPNNNNKKKNNIEHALACRLRRR